MTEINTHNLRIQFGKHKGELWTRVPVSYLKWLSNQLSTNPSDGVGKIAAAELKRRGTVTPTIEVSGHAIDRASLSCRKTWHQTAIDGNEGLHAWLCRMAQAALDKQPEYRRKRAAEAAIVHEGLVFVFQFGECWPVLKTIHPK